MTGKTCAEDKCAWWCEFGQDCAVPLTAGILADSEINRICWDTVKKEGEHHV
jgi:hypothetical protein